MVQKANKFTPATRLLVQRFVPFPAVGKTCTVLSICMYVRVHVRVYAHIRVHGHVGLSGLSGAGQQLYALLTMGWDNWNRTYVDREKVTGARLTSSVSKTWDLRPLKGP